MSSIALVLVWRYAETSYPPLRLFPFVRRSLVKSPAAYPPFSISRRSEYLLTRTGRWHAGVNNCQSWATVNLRRTIYM
jgi:hypothetical protein